MERDIVSSEQLAEALTSDDDAPRRVVAEVASELSDAPAGEEEPDRFQSGGGRLDDEGLVVSRDPAGTATRPLGVQ